MLQLRKFVPAHITPSYLGWLNDQSRMKHSLQGQRRHTVESALEYLKTFDGTPHYFWGVFVGDVMVGTATAYVTDNHDSADVGLLIGAPGCGYGTAAWCQIMAVLEALGVSRMTAGTKTDNLAMRRVLEKSCMTYVRMDADYVYYERILLQTSQCNKYEKTTLQSNTTSI